MHRVDASQKVTIKTVECDIDSTKLLSLGFSSAGWQEHKRLLQKTAQKVFTSGTTVLDPRESYYKQSHDAVVLKRKSKNKRVDYTSVEKAHEMVEGLLNKLNYFDSWEALLDRFLELETYPKEKRKEYTEQVYELFKEDGEKIGCGSLVLRHVVPAFRENQTILYRDRLIEFHGYTFIRFLATLDNLESYLVEDDKELAKEISEWAGYVNLQHPGEEIQAVLANAKALISDWLQVNLMAIIEHKPLVRIYFDLEQQGESPFKPNLDSIVKKARHSYTAAELRVIYKLKHEVGNELMTELLDKLVTFYAYHPAGEAFVQIDAPWSGQHREKWTTRKRSEDRLVFFKREPDQVPLWVRQLVELAEKAEKCIENRPSLGSNLS